jgi:hypothetical protein
MNDQFVRATGAANQVRGKNNGATTTISSPSFNRAYLRRRRMRLWRKQRERRCCRSYIESQVCDRTSLVKSVHTIVTKLLFVIVPKDVNINSVRHNSCRLSSVIVVTDLLRHGGKTHSPAMFRRSVVLARFKNKSFHFPLFVPPHG